VLPQAPQAVADDRLDEVGGGRLARPAGGHGVGAGWRAGAGSRSGGAGAGCARGGVTGTSTGSTVIRREGPGSEPRAGLEGCSMTTTSVTTGPGVPDHALRQ